MLLIAAVALYAFVKEKEREANSLWIVHRSDLKFSDPPTVLGHGSFGFVLQGEYRGSKVAVKRVLPPASAKRKGKTEGTMFGSPLKLESRDSSTLLVPATETPSSSDSSGQDLEMGGKHENTDTSSGRGKRDQARLSQSIHTKRTGMSTTRNGSLQKMKQAFMEEMRVLSKLRHRNVTTLMGKNVDSITCFNHHD